MPCRHACLAMYRAVSMSCHVVTMSCREVEFGDVGDLLQCNMRWWMMKNSEYGLEKIVKGRGVGRRSVCSGGGNCDGNWEVRYNTYSEILSLHKSGE